MTTESINAELVDLKLVSAEIEAEIAFFQARKCLVEQSAKTSYQQGQLRVYAEMLDRLQSRLSSLHQQEKLLRARAKANE